jgi:hypothetical protein
MLGGASQARTKGGTMSQAFYFIVPTQERARQIVAQIRQVRLELNNISVIDDGSDVGRIAHPRSEEFRQEVNRGRILISVGLSDAAERDKFMDTLNTWGITEVRYPDEPAA